MDVNVDSGHPYGTCMLIHRMNVLLINQQTVPDGKTSSTAESAYIPDLRAAFLQT
jgi:hypothetical protein